MANRVFLTKRYQLPALHQLRGESYSEEMNLRIFGPCSRLHGHDYEIEVTVSGDVDPKTGILLHRDQLDEIVTQEILEPYTGANLSDHFPHTTGEALALEFFELLRRKFSPPPFLARVKVNETAKNSFTVDGGQRSRRLTQESP